MQPTFTQVPPSVLSRSTHTVLSPSCAARIAATYPPGPPPMISTSGSRLSVMRFVRCEQSLDEHRRGILDQLLDPHEKEHRLLPVDEPMIVREREIHHRPDLHLLVDGDGAILNLVQPENRDLRIVDDRRRHERAEHAAVRDREAAAGQI